MAESGRWVTIRGHRVFINDKGNKAAVVVGGGSGGGYRPASATKRFNLGTKLGTGQWISQGSFPTEDAAKARAREWLGKAGPSGRAVIRDEIGREVWSSTGIGEANRRSAESSENARADYARAWYVAGGGGNSNLGPYENESDARAALARTTDHDFADGVVVKGYSEANAKHTQLVRARRQRGKERGL